MESEKPVTYYCRRNDKDNRLECEVVFNEFEMKMFRKGPEAYLLMICKEPERDLDAAGAIRPYQYRCAMMGRNTYMLTVGEF